MEDTPGVVGSVINCTKPDPGSLIEDTSILDECCGIVCEICCYKGYCVQDELICTVDPKSDYNIIAILLMVVAGLLIGIPLILLILDLLMLRRPFGCASSFCEFLANYICSWCCLNSKYRKMPNRDDVDTFSLASLPKGGKKTKSGREKAITENLGAVQNSV